MIVDHLSDMTKGWFVGNFKPTVMSSDKVEVAIKQYAAGTKEAKHHHKIATEITVVVTGLVMMNDLLLTAGDIVTVSPGESAEFTSIQDSITTVVKLPCVPNDKYLD